MVFENRYPVSKEVYMDWAKHPVNKNKVLFRYLWILLFALMLVCAVFAFLHADLFMFWIACLLSIFCVYQAFFRNKVLTGRQFKLLSTARGEDRWERVVTFTDKITVTDGRSTSEFSYDQLTELVDFREYLALGIGRGLSAQYLRLLKDGFGPQTAQDFIDFFRREYPAVPIRKK
jgi:hypothetical protein